MISAMSADYRPSGFSDITPYLIVEDADRVIEFIKKTFAAEEVLCMRSEEGGKVTHAAYKIGDSMLELSSSRAEWKPLAAGLHVYVQDVDACYQRAIAAGGTSLYEPADMYYGERSGGVADPCGNQWYLATVKEDLTLAEVEKRAAQQKS